MIDHKILCYTTKQRLITKRIFEVELGMDNMLYTPYSPCNLRSIDYTNRHDNDKEESTRGTDLQPNGIPILYGSKNNNIKRHHSSHQHNYVLTAVSFSVYTNTPTNVSKDISTDIHYHK